MSHETSILIPAAGMCVRLLLAGGLTAWTAWRGWVASRRAFGVQPWDIEVLVVSTLAATALTVAAIVLGVAGVLHDWTWLLLSWALAWFLPRLVRRAEAPRQTAGGAPSVAFAVVIGGLVVGRMLYSLRNPPADWDSLYYHLPMLAHWIQTGTLGVPLRDPPSFGSYFPGGGEVLALFGAWATGRDTLTPWPGTIAVGLLALAVRRAALLVGARGAVAEGVAVAMALAPGLVQLTMGVRVDQLVALWLAVALWAALRLRRDGGQAEAALMVLALGLLGGTKSTGPALIGLVVLVALVGPRWRERGRALVTSRVALLVGLLTGGFWYLRNALSTGNPEFPAGLRIGAIALPGLLDQDVMRRTSQVAVWAEGYAGHTTIGHLWQFYGPGLGVLAIGVVLAIPRLRRAAPGTRMLLTVALAAAALYLFGPFSGAYLPAAGGQPPKLNFDNLRLLMPAIIAAAPVAAAGLSRIPFADVVGAGIGLMALAILYHYLGHLGPGMAIAGAALIAVRWARGRRRAWGIAAGSFVAGAAALAAIVTVVQPARERVADQVWDGFTVHIHNLDAATIRALRQSADRRPIACAGLDSWWAYYGDDFSGHPVYVPVARHYEGYAAPLAEAPEARERADHDRWLANLAAMDAAFVVVGSPGGDCVPHYIEADWCAADTARFVPIAARLCDHAYGVRTIDAPARAGEGR